MFAIGASCGGGLAIGVALKYLEYGTPEHVKGVVALAPMTIHPDYVPDKFRQHLKSWEENREGPIVDFDGMMIFQSNSTRQLNTRLPLTCSYRSQWFDCPEEESRRLCSPS